MQITLGEFNPDQIFNNEGWCWFGTKRSTGAEAFVVSTENLSLVTHMKDDETAISGEERIHRIVSNNEILVGPEIFLAFRQDRRSVPSIFRSRHNEEGKIRRFFCPGGLLQNPSGQKCEFYFWLDESGKFLFHALPMDAPRTSRDLSIVLISNSDRP